MIYDPFPRQPTTVARVRMREGRAYRPAANGVINLPAPNAPRVKHVKKGRKLIKRIIVK